LLYIYFQSPKKNLQNEKVNFRVYFYPPPFFNLFVMLVLSALSLSSCKKDTLVQDTTTHNTGSVNYTITNGRVAFETVDDYDMLGNMEDEQLRNKIYNEMKAAKPTHAAARTIGQDPVVDSILSGIDFLNTVLNDDEIVQIADEIVKLDFINEKAYLLNAANENSTNMNKLKVGDADGSIVKELDMSTDVVALIESGGGSVESGIFCSEDGVGETQKATKPLYLYVTSCPQNEWMEARAQYQKLAIYFRLFADANVLNISSAHPELSYFQLDAYRKYKPRCRDEVGWALLQGFTAYTNSSICSSSAGSNIRLMIYNNTRALNKLRVEARAHIRVNGVLKSTEFVIINKNY